MNARSNNEDAAAARLTALREGGFNHGMDAIPTLARWWQEAERHVETTGAAAPEAVGGRPAWLAALERAHAAEIGHRLPEAEEALAAAAAGVPEGAWRRVLDLLALRVEIRRADVPRLSVAEARAEAFAGSVPAGEPETAARAWHALGTLEIRLGRLDVAETALARALVLVSEAPSKTWILDGFAQVFFGTGAWEEARRTWTAALARRERAGDLLGIAITAGHLAHLHTALGEPRLAQVRLAAALAAVSDRVPALSRVRLTTFLVEACLDAGDVPAAEAAAEDLAVLSASHHSPHPLLGYAALARARVAAARGDEDGARRGLAGAAGLLTHPSQALLLRAWEARLLPRSGAGAEWTPGDAALAAAVGYACEGEAMLRLTLAEGAAAGKDLESARAHLDAALSVATSANNPEWTRRVEEAYRRVDPVRAAERIAERYAGVGAAEARTTVEEVASVVFADLVGFTARSQDLPPAETMATARSFYELSSHLLVAHRLRPLAYLGDGLLAVARGDGHPRRARDFARDLVQRCARVSLVRRALSEAWGLDCRAGVATGPVVMGPLGTHLKTEWTVIGRTANLAARLQGAAKPGEVVSSGDPALDSGPAGAPETVSLKGFPAPVAVRRETVGI